MEDVENRVGGKNDGNGKDAEDVGDNKKVNRSRKRERYQVNLFEETRGIHDEPEKESTYTYFLRPFIPFWSLQSLRFEDVNNYNVVPTQREGKFPRFVMQKLVRTWLNKDKRWFDRKEIFEILREDIGAMLESTMLPKKDLPRSFYDIQEFPSHRYLILDCWAIYHHLNFQNSDFDVSFDFFPLWQNSTNFKFNLYFEVKRVSPEDEPLAEMEEGKRLWMKEEGMSFEIYKKHLCPTIFNTDIKILTTQDYVPQYLRKLLSKTLVDHDKEHNIMHIQKDPVIIRYQPKRKYKKLGLGEMIKNEERLTENEERSLDDGGCASQHPIKKDDQKETEDVSGKHKEEEEDVKNDKLKVTEELATKPIIESQGKMMEYKDQIRRLNDKMIDLEAQNKRLKEENAKKNSEMDLKIVEQSKTIEDLTTLNKTSANEIKSLEKLLMEERKKNEAFKSPISAQILSNKEKDVMVEFTEFAYNVSSQPNSVKSKVRALERQIKLIEKYQNNTNDIFEKFKSRLRKPISTLRKDNLRKEILLRMAHNQSRINNIKETIRIFLKQKYKEEFDGLVHVIPKLNGFLVYCKENPQDYSKLSCPDKIMDMDLLELIRKYTKNLPEIRPMTIYENYKYRNLVDDEDDTESVEIVDSDEIDEMDEEEREKRFYKPFHDQNLH